MAVLLLPYSLIGPFAGVLLDRWRRRQVFLYGNLLRALLACVTAVLILGHVPDWLFYVSALSVTAVNRFVLAGLSAALPRVVDDERLVMANSLSPTAGTLAATAGGGLAFAVRLVAATPTRRWCCWARPCTCARPSPRCASRRDLLGPDQRPVRPRLGAALAGTARGLVGGRAPSGRAARRAAAWALAAMTLMRFCYGALTVMVLMLCRYAWSRQPESDGLALLGLAVGISGAGFFAAAVVTPWAAGRLGPGRLDRRSAPLPPPSWSPPLGLPFTPAPMLVAAFVLGLITQGAKIATDTVVQSSVDDGFRGRIFSVYDVLFNVAFVGAAAVAALMLPPDGRSAARGHGGRDLRAIAGAMARFDPVSVTSMPQRPSGQSCQWDR